jgi:hypothetical protein
VFLNQHVWLDVFICMFQYFCSGDANLLGQLSQVLLALHLQDNCIVVVQLSFGLWLSFMGFVLNICLLKHMVLLMYSHLLIMCLNEIWSVLSLDNSVISS